VAQNCYQLERSAHLLNLHLEISSDDEESTITYKETHLLNYLNSGSIGISTLSISKLALPSGDRIGINAALKC